MMADETQAQHGDELSVVMPPNARLSAIEFHDAQREVRVSFADGGDRTVPASQIAAIHGAQMRSELVPQALDANIARGFFRPFAPAAQVSKTIEAFSYVFALRVTGVGEVWYAFADSFNFRGALGPDAGYSTESHLRALMRRLSAIAPQATRDDFVLSLIGNVALPPPVDSVFEFFKTAAKDL